MTNYITLDCEADGLNKEYNRQVFQRRSFRPRITYMVSNILQARHGY